MPDELQIAAMRSQNQTNADTAIGIDGLTQLDKESDDEKYSPEGVRCQNTMYLVFVATKRIRRGDVMTLPFLSDPSGLRYLPKGFLAPCT